MTFPIDCCLWSTVKPELTTTSYNRGGQLISSAGHIKPSFESRGPHFGQKDHDNAKKIGLRGPDVACRPYVAPSCPTTTTIFFSHFYFLLLKWPLNNNHLSTTATILGSQGWSLYTGLTVHPFSWQTYFWIALPILFLRRFVNANH